MARSFYYYESAGESALNLDLIRLIDEQYMKTPFYGSPRMTEALKRKGYEVNHKRIERLMRVMGMAAIYPKRHTSQPQPLNRIYPYLLDHLEISRPDQVWASDITYIRLAHGFVFLMAVMDWFSRYILAWELSILLDKEFCLMALDRALSLVFSDDSENPLIPVVPCSTNSRKGPAEMHLPCPSILSKQWGEDQSRTTEEIPSLLSHPLRLFRDFLNSHLKIDIQPPGAALSLSGLALLLVALRDGLWPQFIMD